MATYERRLFSSTGIELIRKTARWVTLAELAIQGKCGIGQVRQIADWDESLGRNALVMIYHAAQDDKGCWWHVDREIEFSTAPSLHKCDWRCQRAGGRDCQCSCRGVNHGAGCDIRPKIECKGE